MRTMLKLMAFALIWLGASLPAQAGLAARVDLSTQTMHVSTSDGEAYAWKISSGRDGYRTIRGNFRPTRLEKNWYSRKYGGAMPNAVFFRGGFAIHGTSEVRKLGRPASHGCVRLAPANAAKFFALVRKHGAGATSIAVYGSPGDMPTRFAKAKSKAPKQLVAKKRVQPPSWDVARERMLMRPSLPDSALGFQPVNRAPQRWR
jgi:L,D-transpeptidase catalytic domain